MSNKHNSVAKKFVAEINNVPVAWCSVLHFPHPKTKNLKKVHRLVVRSDYQGIGIGSCLLNWVAEYYTSHGYRFFIVTGLSYLAKNLSRSNKWVLKRQSFNSPISSSSSKEMAKTTATKRLTASFEFIAKKGD